MTESKCQSIHMVTPIFILRLAGCEWHVPSWAPHLYMACRLLSAMAMQTLFPFAITAIFLAFLDPTFGNKCRESNSGRAFPEDTISLDDIIMKFEAFDEDIMCAEDFDCSDHAARQQRSGSKASCAGYGCNLERRTV